MVKWDVTQVLNGKTYRFKTVTNHTSTFLHIRCLQQGTFPAFILLTEFHFLSVFIETCEQHVTQRFLVLQLSVGVRGRVAPETQT